MSQPDVSIIVITYNSKQLVNECLQSLNQMSQGVNKEILVVDNGSNDDTSSFIKSTYPEIHLITLPTNIGFGAANNRAFSVARGRYILLLNSDAFLHEGALQKAIELMDTHPSVGIGGSRLVGRDGSWQPSARMFPNLLNEFLRISGLAAKYPTSRFLGRAERTWAPQHQSASVDWVPGAFSIIRRELLKKIKGFDERFYLYYEEVDLCRKVRNTGCVINYWPEITITHYGGETCNKMETQNFSTEGMQIIEWELRSMFLCSRKHHGLIVIWLRKMLDRWWHKLRILKNQKNLAKVEESKRYLSLLNLAWADTKGGSNSPIRPWR